jgi:hypothetical protein
MPEADPPQVFARAPNYLIRLGSCAGTPIASFGYRDTDVNQPPPDDEVESIAHEVERYVSLHPTAADTPEGIARWWLTGERQPALNRVEAALELLVQRGTLSRKALPDGNSIYLSERRPPAPFAQSN